MIIGVDIRSFIERSPSGVTEYTYQLLKNLFEVDKENKYLLFYNVWHDISDNFIKLQHQSNIEIRSFHWPNKIFNTSIVFFKYPKIDRLLKGVDLFFTPNLNFVSLSKKCKKIITVHDLSFVKFPEFYSLKGRWWHKIVNPKKIFFESDRIIAVSENTKNDLVRIYNIKQDKIKVIHSGINPVFFQKIDITQLNRIKEKHKITKPYIFSLGNFEPRKNIESLILVFENFRKKYNLDYQLVIAGTQAWTKNKKIHLLAKKSNFSPDIKFLGYIPPKEKPFLYTGSQIFVFISYYEGFGFPPLEAMASGVPAIVSHSSSLPEIVGNGCILVDPYNINEIIENIGQVLTDLRLKDNLIKSGFEVVKQFSWKKTAERTLELFNEVMK